MNDQAPQTAVYAVRTTSGRELDVAFIVEHRVLEKVEKGETTGIKSIFVAPDVRGYIFIESTSLEEVYKVISNIKYVKAVRPLKVQPREVVEMLKPKLVEEEVNVGDEVEITRGPFRGMRAKVLSIDKSKGTVTINLLEVAFSIPITVQISYVKKVKR